MSTHTPWRSWRHVTKLDPDKENTPELINRVLESGTDAIIIGGTQNITLEKVKHLKMMCERSNFPVVIEPSQSKVVDLSFEYFFIPYVLNSQDKWWCGGAHIDWVHSLRKVFGSYDKIPWEKIVIEAYLVLNPEAAVAKVTRSTMDLTAEEIVSHAVFADRIIHAPIVYIEYSGRFGDPDVVKAVKENMKYSHLFYGGGIDSKERAKIMGQFATIVVGNIAYDNIEKYYNTIF